MHLALPLDQALRSLHSCGWSTFEISFEHLIELETAPNRDEAIARVQACMAELDLCTPQAHGLLGAQVARPDATGRAADIARLLTHVDISAQLGVRTVVMHPGGVPADASPDDAARIRKLNVEAFRRIGDFGAERGVRIGIENLMCPGARTIDQMLDVLSAVDHAAVGITLDTSHANVSAIDIPAAIRNWASLLFATHISDNNGRGDQHLVPGRGTIDWPGVMQAFAQTGYGELFNLEIPGERHPDRAMRDLRARHALEVTRWLFSLPGEAASAAPAPSGNCSTKLEK